MKNWVKILACLGVTSILLAELVLRFAVGLGDPPIVDRDPEIEYMLKPNETYHRWGNEISVNDYRMRADPFSIEKTANEVRIMLVGDSVVYGNHRIDQQETIAASLKRDLQSNYPNCTISVGAIAASSWGPENIRAFINRFGLFNPDSVFIIQSSHDVVDYPTHQKNLFPYRTSSPKLAIIDAGIGLAEYFEKKSPKHQVVTLSFEERRDLSEGALRAVLTMSRKATHFTAHENSKATLIFHPTLSQLLNASDEIGTTAKQFYQEVAMENGVNFINGAEAYAKSRSAPEAIYEDNIHPSAEGAKTIAEIINAHIPQSLFDECNS